MNVRQWKYGDVEPEVKYEIAMSSDDDCERWVVFEDIDSRDARCGGPLDDIRVLMNGDVPGAISE